MKKPAGKAPAASPPAQYTMKTLDQVRILANPLRLRLLEAFASGPATTQQVAKAFGVPATRLYHHVNALEKVGLIRLRETRPVRGTIEKYYEAVARRMLVEAGLFSDLAGGRSRKDEARRAGLNEVLSTVMDEARHDLTAALDRVRETPEHLRPLALRATVTGTPAQLAALKAKLLGSLRQFRKNAAKKRGAGAKARITLVFTVEAASGDRKPKAGKKLP